LQPSTLAKRGSLFLFLAVIAFYFYGLGHLPFVGPDEPRYAQVAREMFLRGDLITPTLGGHTWFEKPPLLYWMMIAGFKLFGVSEWSARLPSALSGVLTAAAVFGAHWRQRLLWESQVFRGPQLSTSC
jgi:4-amino-4-deoxy-L-arabinose transferase-like glycosyltransferase